MAGQNNGAHAAVREQIVGRERRDVFRNLLGAAKGVLTRAAASTQPFGAFRM